MTDQPRSQPEYQQGLMDGTRYRVDHHEELLEKYKSGTACYRLGWAASAGHPRSQDPDFAT